MLYTGGLVGYNASGTISASYATASVTGGTGTNAIQAVWWGIICGSGTVRNSYFDSTVNAALNAIGFK